MALPLDALTPAHPLSAPLREASLPPEHRLEMPVQSLLHWSNAEERPLAAPERARAPWLARRTGASCRRAAPVAGGCSLAPRPRSGSACSAAPSGARDGSWV